MVDADAATLATLIDQWSDELADFAECEAAFFNFGRKDAES